MKSTEIDAKINITDPEKLQGFLAMEEKLLRDMVDKIAKTNANVVFCQKGIDDMAQHFLSKKGIFAVRRVAKSDMEKLARATGANIITNLDDLTANDLGTAASVEEIKIGDEGMIFVRGCKKAKSVTLLVRGGSEHVVDEAKRAIEDAIGDCVAAIKSNRIVGGAGAAELEVALRLSKFAESLSGREQLAVKAFSEAVEIIPRTLAENAGLDPINIITELKATHDAGKTWAGVDVFSGKVIDSLKEGIVEPLKIKTQAIASATEVASMILRIDDVIASGGKKESTPSGPESYGGEY